MPKSMSAFFAGYAGLEIDLPNGRTVHAKCLPLSTAIKFMRLADRMGLTAGTTVSDPEAGWQILEEFPKVVEFLDGDTAAVWDELTIAEFWEFFWAFFGRRANRPLPSPPATETASMPAAMDLEPTPVSSGTPS